MSFHSFLKGEMKRSAKGFDREAKEQWAEIQKTFDFVKEVVKENEKQQRRGR